MFNINLLEQINIVPAYPPADHNTDKDGDWISLKNYLGCLVVLHKAAGTAGDDFVLKLEQASDVSATGAKALNISRFWAKVGATALSSIGTFTKYSGTAAATIDTVSAFGTDLAADTGEALIVIDVKASDLDVTNGFDCIHYVHEGDDVGNATIASCTYILYGAAYPGASPVSAIAD